MKTIYSHRREDRIVRAITLDREADEWLDAQMGGSKQHGRFLSRLIYEERSRREERARIAREVLTTL